MTKPHKKVLLAEDDELTRFMMSETLQTLGYEFDIAKDGAECCEILKKNPHLYGVILMDLHMPNVSGLDAAKQIRHQTDDPPKKLPIYALTADNNYHDEQSVAENGMNGFLRKPVMASEIDRLVGKYC